jgi:hypothetical protein
VKLHSLNNFYSKFPVRCFIKIHYVRLQIKHVDTLCTLTKHAASSVDDSNCNSEGDGSNLGTLTIQDEGFHGIPPSLQANTRIVPQIRSQQLPSTSFPIHSIIVPLNNSH